jgi:quinol monooxygenase YgiN
MIIAIATAIVRPEARHSFKESACIHVAFVRRQRGCLAYDVHESVIEEGRFVFVERWSDAAAANGKPTRHTGDFLEFVGDYVIEANLIEVVAPENLELA